MTTSQEYFMTVVSCQSVARAAEQLYLSQQNLSNHIKRLEKRYGMLFVRKPRFELTLAGKALYETLQQIRILEQGLDTRLAEIRSNREGILRFGIHSVRARMILPGAMAAFREVYPNVQVKLFLQNTAHNETMLRDGRMDLFLGVNPQHDMDFEYIHLSDEPILFVASERLLQERGIRARQGTIPISYLSRFSFLLGMPDSKFRIKIVETTREAGIELSEKMSVGDYELQLMLAAQGEGACFCDQMMMPKIEQINREREEGGKLRVLGIDGLDATSDISVVVHRLAYRSDIMQAFIESLKKAV
ncbi:MAG: LysR family transcriptional regulator [Eubacteriales bacterium]|nr:LysR family transcriptional regulator [Eubacteriales bacterium]